MYICKYCGKICKNKNGLIQHEIRCKNNPNRITNIGNKGKSKGLIAVTKNNIHKFINKDLLNNYLNDGWILGISENSKRNIKIAASLYKHSGICKNDIDEENRKNKISNSMKGNTNWKNNKHHGNGKKGHYKGIYCDSTWELAFLVYCFEHNINVERCKISYIYKYNDEDHTYIPDFVTDEGIIEIKGRMDQKAKEKIKQFPQIILYDKNKMKPILNYVITKYGKDFWLHLYDKYN